MEKEFWEIIQLIQFKTVKVHILRKLPQFLLGIIYIFTYYLLTYVLYMYVNENSNKKIFLK